MATKKEKDQMSNINRELLKEVGNRSNGRLKEIAIDILTQISDEFASEDRIKENVRRKVDVAVRSEEIK